MSADRYDRIRDAMLTAVTRIGFDQNADPRVQPAMIKAADLWLAHWADLLRENPASAAGPLASLLADTYLVGESLVGGTPCQVDEDRLVTVCAACLCASCWQGKFYCQQARTADTKRLTIRELRALGREHEHYWAKACDRGEA